ncbi:hypothetical protein E1N52_04680 [Paraburkholderia guartelaensis]|jgi:hypothetical protein|uniref:Glycosyl hydrolase n=1 Tax=Paraburkholderia guartelaensis TaxID=2546446 RepID=A0A4R5LJI3_9BURK|nr:hypothetical protein [Paraburkholderia guartelaensis]TDG09819.1 hypothetical protein E1N52_04680 [Paraburkholderia guartelaensis]
MNAPVSHHARCTIQGAPAILTFYPDSRIVRISTDGGQRFEQIRWLFGWQALLAIVGNVEELGR